MCVKWSSKIRYQSGVPNVIQKFIKSSTMNQMFGTLIYNNTNKMHNLTQKVAAANLCPSVQLGRLLSVRVLLILNLLGDALSKFIAPTYPNTFRLPRNFLTKQKNLPQTATAVTEKAKAKSTPKRTPTKKEAPTVVSTPTPARKGRRSTAAESKPIVPTPSTSTGKTTRTPRKPPAKK